MTKEKLYKKVLPTEKHNLQYWDSETKSYFSLEEITEEQAKIFLQPDVSSKEALRLAFVFVLIGGLLIIIL